LEELKQQQQRLNQEKVDLENQLEAEQEYIVNKLQKQVDGLAKEKANLQQEKADLRRHVRPSPLPTNSTSPFASLYGTYVMGCDGPPRWWGVSSRFFGLQQPCINTCWAENRTGLPETYATQSCTSTPISGLCSAQTNSKYPLLLSAVVEEAVKICGRLVYSGV